MQIQIQQLGLAAYVRMKGATLVKMDGRKFVFESDKTEQEWRVDYAGSESMRHDSLVCEMRNFLKPGQAA